MLLDKVTLLIIKLKRFVFCSMKTSHEDIAMTTSSVYSAEKTSAT